MDWMREAYRDASRVFAELGLDDGGYTMCVQGCRRTNSAYMVVLPARYTSPESEAIIRETSVKRRNAMEVLAHRWAPLSGYLAGCHPRPRRSHARRGLARNSQPGRDHCVVGESLSRVPQVQSTARSGTGPRSGLEIWIRRSERTHGTLPCRLARRTSTTMPSS